jgi:HEPN domain-containing protein
MMPESVPLWVMKADHDFKDGTDQLRTDEPATDTICFHMQQCAEKYLKAYLVSKSAKPARTHDIQLLICLCANLDESFNRLLDGGCDKLTLYAVDIRYPDDLAFPAIKEAEQAIALADEIRKFVMGKLCAAGYQARS